MEQDQSSGSEGARSQHTSSSLSPDQHVRAVTHPGLKNTLARSARHSRDVAQLGRKPFGGPLCTCAGARAAHALPASTPLQRHALGAHQPRHGVCRAPPQRARRLLPARPFARPLHHPPVAVRLPPCQPRSSAAARRAGRDGPRPGLAHAGRRRRCRRVAAAAGSDAPGAGAEARGGGRGGAAAGSAGVVAAGPPHVWRAGQLEGVAGGAAGAKAARTWARRPHSHRPAGAGAGLALGHAGWLTVCTACFGGGVETSVRPPTCGFPCGRRCPRP